MDFSSVYQNIQANFVNINSFSLVHYKTHCIGYLSTGVKKFCWHIIYNKKLQSWFALPLHQYFKVKTNVSFASFKSIIEQTTFHAGIHYLVDNINRTLNSILGNWWKFFQHFYNMPQEGVEYLYMLKRQNHVKPLQTICFAKFGHFFTLNRLYRSL